MCNHTVYESLSANCASCMCCCSWYFQPGSHFGLQAFGPIKGQRLARGVPGHTGTCGGQDSLMTLTLTEVHHQSQSFRVVYLQPIRRPRCHTDRLKYNYLWHFCVPFHCLLVKGGRGSGKTQTGGEMSCASMLTANFFSVSRCLLFEWQCTQFGPLLLMLLKDVHTDAHASTLALTHTYR